MSRRCDLTDKGAQAGLQISHSNHKTHRKFNMNLHNVTLRSDLLKKDFVLRVAISTLRSIDHNGGLDNFLISAKAASLSPLGQKIRRVLKKSATPVVKAAKAPADAVKKRIAKKAAAKKAVKKSA